MVFNKLMAINFFTRHILKIWLIIPVEKIYFLFHKNTHDRSNSYKIWKDFGRYSIQ